MYLINDYQLQFIQSQTFVFSENKAAKISNHTLSELLIELQQQEKYQISEEELAHLAATYQLDLESLKKLLIHQLDVIRPLLSRKFLTIYINIDTPLVRELLHDTLCKCYNIEVVGADYNDYQPGSLIIFYRNNYSHADFKTLYHRLPNNVYLITAGVIHHLLVIDNLYFNDSGLPTHVSNLHQMMTFLKSNLSITKDNWLLFYRSMARYQMESFPEPIISPCQQGFVAHALHQFISQYTHFWKAPTTMDKVNWFWHVDLTNFNVHQEVAIHSMFSDYDMKLNLNHINQAELMG